MYTYSAFLKFTTVSVIWASSIVSEGIKRCVKCIESEFNHNYIDLNIKNNSADHKIYMVWERTIETNYQPSCDQGFASTHGKHICPYRYFRWPNMPEYNCLESIDAIFIVPNLTQVSLPVRESCSVIPKTQRLPDSDSIQCYRLSNMIFMKVSALVYLYCSPARGARCASFPSQLRGRLTLLEPTWNEIILGHTEACTKIFLTHCFKCMASVTATRAKHPTNIRVRPSCASRGATSNIASFSFACIEVHLWIGCIKKRIIIWAWYPRKSTTR